SDPLTPDWPPLAVDVNDLRFRWDVSTRPPNGLIPAPTTMCLPGPTGTLVDHACRPPPLRAPLRRRRGGPEARREPHALRPGTRHPVLGSRFRGQPHRHAARLPLRRPARAPVGVRGPASL